ncbi:Hypothetical predicted protein [Olea europaea subsp. europaea]|uniref:Uncharacterized protein n=1 Tax=Olea europaea subsp. europaea TaxID=158383 RepID=A0A8S0UGB6_OLEEU|nr:Hypothetical predicted protein [Olea europaea subsp. europaea]
MQRGREVRENSSNNSGSAFDDFEGFGFSGSMFPSIFGGRDPFDDPFFTRPFGSMFGSSAFGSNSAHGESRHASASRSKGPIIEELDSDDERVVEDKGHDVNTDGDNEDKFKENAWSNRNPLVEHPEDQTRDHRQSTSNGREVSYRTNHGKAEGSQPQSRSVNFQRVTYGGINGAYYTATTTRKTGSDGVILEDSKQADKTTGEATHRISRGIHDKGHSLTRKLDTDGKVDTMQTLHNLAEDELPGFEQAWKGNVDGHLPGWNTGFDSHSGSGNTGGAQTDLASWGGFARPFSQRFGRDEMFGLGRNSRAQSSGGRPKKVVTINIE